MKKNDQICELLPARAELAGFWNRQSAVIFQSNVSLGSSNALGGFNFLSGNQSNSAVVIQL